MATSIRLSIITQLTGVPAVDIPPTCCLINSFPATVTFMCPYKREKKHVLFILMPSIKTALNLLVKS